VFLHARPSADYDLVNIDRSSGTRHALHSLKLLGHRKVFYMGIHTANERITGSYQLWRSWFEENGEGDPEEYSCFVPNESGGGGQGWKEIVSRGIHPTAVLAYNDIIACGLIQSARNDGKRVPEDLSVIGSDDIDEGWRLGLTTMSGDLRLAASIALRQLEERRSGDTRPPVVHRVEAEFVMRNTVGPARR
jgi:DNA-binding LacI/PurR family transcriptional regulator